MRMRSLVLYSSLLALAAASVSAQDGFGDTTFSTDGLQLVDWSGDSAGATSVADGPDGSLLIGGSVQTATSTDFGAVKLDAAGELVAGWGLGGRRLVTIDAMENGADRLEAIVRLPDGSALLAGFAEVAAKFDNYEIPAVAKLTPTGALDGGFGDAGIALFELPWASDSWGWNGVVEQPDGKLLFFGYCYQCPDNDSDSQPMLLRVTSAGTADPTFSDDGWASPTTGEWSTVYPYAVAFDATGRVLIFGQGDAGFSISRLTSAGAIDPSYGGGDGVSPFAMPVSHTNPYAFTLDPATGAMYLGMSFFSGALDDQSGVIRLTAAGAVDGTWAGDGLAEIDFDQKTWIWRLVVQSDGKPLGIGLITNSGDTDFFVFRLEVGGGLDSTFHGNGARRIDFGLAGAETDWAFGLELSGGRAVIVGEVGTGDVERSFGIARTTSGLVFRDGFERASSGGWGDE